MVKHFVAEFTMCHPKIEAEFTMPKNKPMEVEFTMQGATRDHTLLVNRDKPDQHPISAITGLEEALQNTDKTFVFEQGIATDTWTINHDLEKYPSVMVVDSAGNAQIPDEIEYISQTQIIVKFVSAFAGTAYLN